MMKNYFLKTVLLVAFMSFLGMSVNAQQQTTVNYVFSAQGFANADVLASGTIDDNLTYLAEKNSSSNAPAYYTSGTNARFYYAPSGNGCSYTIGTKNGSIINSVKLYGVAGNVPTVKYNIDGGSDVTATLNSSDNTYTISDISAETSFKFRNANTASAQLRITQIDIVYTPYTSSIKSNDLSFNGIKISASKGSIDVKIEKDVQVILVYNTLGQLVKSVSGNVGVNTISVPSGQLYIVKVGAKVSKVLVK